MKILTDSAADLPAQEIDSLGVTVAPLTIHFPDGEVKSNHITPDEFYDRLKQMYPNIPTTSQPSPGAFADIYRNLGAQGDEILSVHISSGLSGTIEAARTGARQAPEADVTFVDTLTLSGGERYQVMAAARAARENWSKQRMLDCLDQVRQATELVFTLDTLEYLARGGRIGRVQALAGSLLKIKPVIHVDKVDGKYNTAGRGRTLPKAMDTILAHLGRTYDQNTPLWVTVLHGKFLEQAEMLAEKMRGQFSVAKLEILRISPVLGVHTGPGVVGVAVVPMQVMEGLE